MSSEQQGRESPTPGGVQYLVEVSDHTGKLIQKPLTEGACLSVGSATPQADIYLEKLARFQARICLRGGQVTVENLGGIADVRLRAKPLPQGKPQLWMPDAPLAIGPYRPRLVLVSLSPTAPQSPAVQTPAEGIDIEISPRNVQFIPGTLLPVTVKLSNRTSEIFEGNLQITIAGAPRKLFGDNALLRPVIIEPTPAVSLELFDLIVPKQPQSRAGNYEVVISLTPRAGGSQTHTFKKETLWRIQPYSDPPNITELGSWKRIEQATWEHRLSLENPTNRRTFYRLSATPDQSDGPELQCNLDPDALLIDAGASALTILRVSSDLSDRLDSERVIEVLAESNADDEPRRLELPFRPAHDPFEYLQGMSREPRARLGLALTTAVLLILIGFVLTISTIISIYNDNQAAAKATEQVRQAAAFETGVANAQAAAELQFTTVISTQQSFAVATIQAQATAVVATIQAQATAVVSTTMEARVLANAIRATQNAEIQPVRQTAKAFTTDLALRQAQATVAAVLATRESELFQTADAARITIEAGVGGTATLVANQTATSDAQRTVVAQGATQQAIVNATQVAQEQPIYFTIGVVKPCVGVGESLGNVVITVYNTLNRPASMMTDTVRVELLAVNRQSGRLQGTLERQLDDGIARFTDLSIDAEGFYQLLGRYRRFEPQPSERIYVGPAEKCPVPSYPQP